MGESRILPFFSLTHRTSLFLLSAATLIVEVNLSRIFSVSQFYHFAFMIVSLALLGFGASGTFLAIFPRFGRQDPSQSLGILSFGAAVSILGSYILVNKVPFDSFSIAWEPKQVGIFAFHYFVLAMPFFFSGMAVGLLLDVYNKAAGRVYAANLIGSAVGCLAAIAAPHFLAGEGTLLLSSGIVALGGLVPLLASWEKSSPAVLVTLLTGFLLLGSVYGMWHQVKQDSPLPVFELAISPYKGLSYALQYPGAETITQRWNAFSRVDIVSSQGIRSVPGISYRYTGSLPEELGLLVDADNLNPVVLPESNLSFTGYFLEAVAFELRPKARVLVLEPGGGLDLLTAISHGALQVTAVEPNPIIHDEVYLYALPGVEPIEETGRSFLRRTTQSYDVVLFSLTDGYHPVRSGAYSLVEDYRHTLEAYQDAFERLDQDGILVIRSWLQMPPSEFLRSFILAVTALEQKGLDPGEYIAAIRSYNAGLLIIKKTPFQPGELEIIRNFSAERAFDIVYLPGIQPDEVNHYNILEEPVYFKTFVEFLETPERQAWLDMYPYDVSPPTDNHPFFGHYFKWSQAPTILAELGKSWQPFGGAGYFVLLVLLAFAVVMASLIILLPLAFLRRSAVLGETKFASFSYFGLIGLAFLLVEIPLVQHLILYLGHPAYALTTGLFSILLFSGIGSLNSKHFPQHKAIAALVVIILATPWLLETIFRSTLGFPLVIRGLIAIGMLAPLGFLMGIPFPSGILRMEINAPDLIPWVWGVNGAFSVISSILAALIALSFGFSWSLLVGAVCYAGAWKASKHLGSHG